MVSRKVAVKSKSPKTTLSSKAVSSKKNYTNLIMPLLNKHQCVSTSALYILLGRHVKQTDISKSLRGLYARGQVKRIHDGVYCSINFWNTIK